LIEHGEKNGLIGTKSKTWRNILREDGTFIKPLIDAGLIEAHENGWIVIDPGTATGMMQAKK
jgi:hypothetical protein